MELYDGYGKSLIVSQSGNTNHLNGKKWLPIGDSITNSSGYPSVLCSAYGMSEITGGHAGGRQVGYASGANNSALEKLDDIASGTPDIITIALGTNDWGNSCPLGTIDDNPASQSAENFTFYGCYKKLVETLYARYPNAPFVLFTPFKRTGFTGKNSAGYTLGECAEAVRNIAQYYSFVCCDLFSESGLSVGTISEVTDSATWDGLHFNRPAMAVPVPKMAHAMDLAIQKIHIPCKSMSQSGTVYTLTSTTAQRIWVNCGSDCTETVTWESGDDGVVSVVAERNNIYANIYAVSDGTTTVTAKCGNVSATFNIVVTLE